MERGIHTIFGEGICNLNNFKKQFKQKENFKIAILRLISRLNIKLERILLKPNRIIDKEAYSRLPRSGEDSQFR